MTSFNIVRIAAATVILCGSSSVQSFSSTSSTTCRRSCVDFRRSELFPRGCMMAIKDRPKQLFYRSSGDDAGSSKNLPFNDNVEQEDEGVTNKEVITSSGIGSIVPFSILPFDQLPWIIPTDQLEQLKVSDLRLACQQRQLPKSGTKAKLVERLRNWSAAESKRLVSKKQRRQLAKEMLRIDSNELVKKQSKEMKINLRDADTLYKEAKTRDMNGDIEGAKEVLEELLKLTPDDFRIARRLARISHPQVAKRILQDSLRRAPKNGYLWHGLAQCSKDDTSLAREYYKKGCQYGCVNSFHALGGLECKEGNIREAARLFRAGLKKFPENHRLYHALGTLQLQAGLYNQAQKTFREGLKYAPNYGKSFLLLGLSYLEFQYNRDITLARYYIKESLKTNPMFEKGWLALALLDDDAITVYQRATITYEGQRKTSKGKFKGTKDKWAAVYQAFANHPDLSHKDSLLVLKKASKLFPHDWRIWRDLALKSTSDLRIGYAFERSVKASGGREVDPYYFYAKFLITNERYDDARRVFYRASMNAKTTQNSSRLFAYWASVEASQLNIERAESLYSLALQCLPAVNPNLSSSNTRPTSYSKTLIAKERGRILLNMAKLYIESNPYKARNFVAQSLCYNMDLPEAWKLWADLVTNYDDNLAKELRSYATLSSDGIDLSGVRLMGNAPWNNVYNMDSIGQRLKSLTIDEESE